MANKEARLRRWAERCGYKLCKSRARNPDKPGYGLYCIIDPRTGNPLTRGDSIDRTPFGSTLEEIREWLEEHCADTKRGRRAGKRGHGGG